MKNSIIFFVFITIIFLFSLIREIKILLLSVIFFSLLLIVTNDFTGVFKKILKLIFPYVGAYLLFSYTYSLSKHYITLEPLTTSLRVVLLSMISFFFIKKFSFLKIISFSKDLSRIFTIAFINIRNFIRTLTEMEEAARSRGGGKKNFFFPSIFKSFFLKSIFRAEEVNNAFKSRGLYF